MKQSAGYKEKRSERTSRLRRDIATNYNRCFRGNAAEFQKSETLRYPAPLSGGGHAPRQRRTTLPFHS